MSDATLKLKGKKLYRGETPVAEIRGYREWVKGTPHGEFAVVVGKQEFGGFCYFKDAVKWAKAIVPGMVETVIPCGRTVSECDATCDDCVIERQPEEDRLEEEETA